MSAGLLAAVETAREDGWGRVGWLHLPGHVDLDVATAVFWAYIAADEDEEFLARWERGETGPSIARGGPVHTWLTRRPYDLEEDDPDSEGCEFYEYGPERAGAEPITVADLSSPSWRRCWHWPACHNRADIGWPIERFSNVDPADTRLDRGYVRYCRDHAVDADRRYREAVRAALAERAA